MLRKIIPLCLLAVLISLSLHASAPSFVYVAATYVRIRATPDTSGAVVATLPIGTWAKVVERSENKQNLLDKYDYWYKISVDNEQQGWIFGGLTWPVTEDERFSKAIELINDRLAMEGKELIEHMQVCEFAANIKEMASHSAEKARLELAFLNSLDNIGKSLWGSGSYGIENHRKNVLINRYKNLVYYHENAGRFFVDPDSYWELSDKYSDIPAVADDIAWVAANQQLAGETEGDLLAILGTFRLTAVAYMQKFPHGQYTAAALKEGTKHIEYVKEHLSPNYFSSKSEKRDFLAELTNFKTVAQKCQESTELTAFINALDALSSKVNN